MQNNFYTQNELQKLGLCKFGTNVLISRKCSIYNAHSISIGNNVRIDDFCILSGNISIGNYVHISAHVSLYGKGGIKIGNYCGISPKSTIFSASDDFSGNYMISPMVPEELTNVYEKTVYMADYSQLGANTVVMPGVKIGEGAVTGVFSLVRYDLTPWSINYGIPCKFYKARVQNVIQLAKKIKL